MKMIILISLLQSVVSFDLPQDGCRSQLKINDDHFNSTHIYNVGDVYPTDAHFDVYGNLFYVESGRNERGFYFNINVIKFKTTDAQKIQGLPEGLSYSIAMDKKNAKVYFGTGMGIYSYSYETHNATPISKSALKLDLIFVDKDSNKYITEHNNGIEELYRLDGDKKVRMSNLQSFNEMAIDDQNNFYYILGEEICVLKATRTESSCFGKVHYNGIAQISIHDERVFIASNNLTYFHVNEINNLNSVDNLPGQVTAIAFEHTGDFVLGVPGKIIKYKKNDCHLKKNVSINKATDGVIATQDEKKM